jgi:hypothetical protein
VVFDEEVDSEGKKNHSKVKGLCVYFYEREREREKTNNKNN